MIKSPLDGVRDSIDVVPAASCLLAGLCCPRRGLPTWEIVRRQPAISGADFRTDFSFRARPRRTFRNGSGTQLSSPEYSSRIPAGPIDQPRSRVTKHHLPVLPGEYRMTKPRLRIVPDSSRNIRSINFYRGSLRIV